MSIIFPTKIDNLGHNHKSIANETVTPHLVYKKYRK